jgi:hypothetical protein
MVGEQTGDNSADEDLKAYLGAMESRLNERIEATELRLNERIERVETQLLTEFHKWASPVECGNALMPPRYAPWMQRSKPWPTALANWKANR